MMVVMHAKNTVGNATTAQPVATPPLIHRPTNRVARIVCAENLLSTEPSSIEAQKYILFLASEKLGLPLDVREARKWLDAGARYVCAWGPASSKFDDLFDYASLLPELGTPLPFTLMTTSHNKETLEEALSFAFYHATAPEDLEAALNTIVILVDSPLLAERCAGWVREDAA